MHLFNTEKGIILQNKKSWHLVNDEWDLLINRENLYEHLLHLLTTSVNISEEESKEYLTEFLLPPITTQEVWAAGVTYLRSRDARMDESKESGGADCYSKVYDAERPELFFKAMPHRVVGHGQNVYIRKDSTWNVPEPELTLYINSSGTIQGYTIGNDMSSRSIEGENPLYLPQAKMYERSAALGPALYVLKDPIAKATTIRMKIIRKNKIVFEDAAAINRMKRSLTELVSFLYSELDFASGCFLMTGTCIVPPNNFTLQEDDVIDITIDGIGQLTNIVALNKSNY
jgi:2-dehydro-3-deoxy-D-arabinonate dehydratase